MPIKRETHELEDISRRILSDITTYSKYSKYIEESIRRETWKETVIRNREMHIEKYKHLGPEFVNEIKDIYQYVIDKLVLPSMRSLQFGGKPIELSPNRLYNCAFAPCDHPAIFSETMFLLLGGSGVGYSVQQHDVAKLPEIIGTKKRVRRHLIGDSIEGWADAVKVLVDAYFYGKGNPNFDFRDIRPRGTLLKTSGGRAPGPQPLKDCLHNIRKVFDMAIETRGSGTKLTTLEVHDIMCYIADAVLSGGIRRAALISLFSFDDDLMLTCKYGNWYELNPQRARANNSAVALRHKIKAKDFREFWKKVQASGSGEPGIYFTNDKSYGCNPSMRAGTRVLTQNGIFPIERLQDSEFKVKNLSGEWSDARCWLSGKNKPLYKISLEGGHEYYSTAEHEWPIWNGKEFVKCSTTKLSAGDKLPLLRQDKLFNGTSGTRLEGFYLGWRYGDGWKTVRSDNGRNQYGLIVSKKDDESDICSKLTSYFQSIRSNATFSDRGFVYELNTQNKLLDEVDNFWGADKKSDGIPTTIWERGSFPFIQGFIDGIFSSDGHIESGRQTVITLTSAHEKLIRDVSDLLGFFGIKSAINKYTTALNGKEFQGFRLRISETFSIAHFRKLFTLSVKHKQNRLDAWSRKRGSSDFVKILSIEATDIKEDVWDISVKDDTHCFQIAHCITGNCCEIALKPNQFCNLTTINAGDIQSQQDLNMRARAAAFIGTLQAGYTDFHYLRDIWKETTEKESLIGVSMTGIASGAVLPFDLSEAASIVIDENRRVAEKIGIKPSARTTCIKPEGTSSLVLGCSSGIHAWHAPYYIRRLRLSKEEAIYKYLKRALPELIEDDVLKPENDAVLSVPIRAPENAIMRTESPIELLERGKRFFNEWVIPGHVSGQNTHNVSITVSIKDNEWDDVGGWMWENRNSYNGIAVLPYYGGSYQQAPFEECNEEIYNSLLEKVRGINLKKVTETEDNTQLKENVACGGGACTITHV